MNRFQAIELSPSVVKGLAALMMLWSLVMGISHDDFGDPPDIVGRLHDREYESAVKDKDEKKQEYLRRLRKWD